MMVKKMYTTRSTNILRKKRERDRQTDRQTETVFCMNIPDLSFSPSKQVSLTLSYGEFGDMYEYRNKS